MAPFPSQCSLTTNWSSLVCIFSGVCPAVTFYVLRSVLCPCLTTFLVHGCSPWNIVLRITTLALCHGIYAARFCHHHNIQCRVKSYHSAQSSRFEDYRNGRNSSYCHAHSSMVRSRTRNILHKCTNTLSWRNLCLLLRADSPTHRPNRPHLCPRQL